MVSVNDKSITLKVIKRRKINVNVYKPSSFECHVYSAEFGINYEFQYMYYGMREFDQAEMGIPWWGFDQSGSRCSPPAGSLTACSAPVTEIHNAPDTHMTY